ncbi:acetyl-CoA hydrolase/transferase C-terminal domain-containing protein [Hydrogenophaga sp.]|uniref:acetyl-CoA hydrolase/transferase family protein n=1 Tax=Hydrogenophaga sp. TaxID=1904254 RepID=UPI0019A22AB3|nr:acetyl-CoA hydrolase/transferase C-terminal domain-containing protein [Hydrogenophaga sp.]MBD3893194.1 4-hydroxybutyrate CoA-transferase [Hydrogenophaga sp.]
MNTSKNYQADLQTKLRSAEQVAATVHSGQRLDYGFALCEPDAFDAALAARKSELREVVIRGALSLRPRQVVEQDPLQQHFINENWHFSGYDRKKGEQGLVSYIPFNFGEGPSIYRRLLEVDLLVLKTAPMDSHGFFNFGVSNTYTRAICDVAKRIVVETCSSVPVCYGVENVVHISEVDAVIEGGHAALPELPGAPITDLDLQVADYIVHEIGDGICLQVGVGGMPNAVCSAIAQSKLHDLGIHTEMFVDGMVDLIEAGKVSGRHKQTHPGKIVFTFAVGTQRTYDFLHQNEACLSLPVDQTNLPHKIAENHNVVSINNCIQIDLSGQVASESSGYRHISGTGGQLQFVRGAFMSPGGKSFMCMSSRYMKGASPASRIVLGLESGTVVTTPRTDVMHVVTEYGLANLKGKSISERARALIAIAHPDERDALYEAARQAGLLGRRFL